MNIIFMGTPAFAVPSLEILLNSNHKISAVVTVPDKPKGRGLKISQSDVKKFAVSKGLNILQPEKLKDPEFITQITDLNPDLIVVVAFRILPKEIYTIPKSGSFNLHASLLPKYRGAAPVNWSIINGDIETGVTSFFLKEKVDTGGIILQSKCEITPDDDAGTLHDKLAVLGADTVLKTVKLIGSTGGNPPVTMQDESIATVAPKIFREDCIISWNRSVRENFNFIRGLSPYPAAFTHLEGKVLKIFKTKIAGAVNSVKTLGAVFVESNSLFVYCNDGTLEILELQLEGKKRITALEFLKGNKPAVQNAALK